MSLSMTKFFPEKPLLLKLTALNIAIAVCMFFIYFKSAPSNGSLAPYTTNLGLLEWGRNGFGIYLVIAGIVSLTRGFTLSVLVCTILNVPMAPTLLIALGSMFFFAAIAP